MCWISRHHCDARPSRCCKLPLPHEKSLGRLQPFLFLISFVKYLSGHFLQNRAVDQSARGGRMWHEDGARYLLQSTSVPRSPRHSRWGRDRWLEVPDSGNLREFPRRLWTLPVILSWRRDSQSSSRYSRCSPPRRQASTLWQGCHGHGVFDLAQSLHHPLGWN